MTIDISEFDGPWVEPCAECDGRGVVKRDMYFLAICPDCDGDCFVEHDHQPELPR